MARDTAARARRPRPVLLVAALALVALAVAACSGPAGSATAARTATVAPAAAAASPTVTRPPATATRPSLGATAPRATTTTPGATATRPAVAAATAAPGEATRAGLAGQTVAAVAAHPADPNVAYAGGAGIARTTDGGATWASVLPSSRAPRVVALAVAPSNAGVVYAGVAEGCARGGPPRPGFVSADGGATWREAGADLGAIAVDPRNARLAYAATCRGVERTGDLGETWEVLTGARVEGYDPLRVAVAPGDPRTVYVAYASEGGTIRARRSEDGGTSWQDASPAGDPFGPLGLAVDAANPRIVYLSAATGVYRSANGGRSWDRLTEGLEATAAAGQPGIRTSTAILAAPATPDLVWLGTGTRAAAGVGVYQSADGGGRWRRIAGLDGRPVGDLALGGQGAARRLYIATDDGVWALVPPAP